MTVSGSARVSDHMIIDRRDGYIRQQALDLWNSYGGHLMIPTPPPDRIYQDKRTS